MNERLALFRWMVLARTLDDGRLRDGHLVVMASVGAGFTVGSVLARW